MNNLPSSEVQQVLTLGREKYWGFRVVEGVGMLSEETYVNGWWYLPVDSIQKKEASKRIEAIKNDGVKIKQIIIAHEAPFLIQAPQAVPKIEKVSLHSFPWKQAAFGLVLAVAGAAAVGLVVCALVMVAYYLLTLLLPILGVMLMVGMLGLGVLIDPVAIIVLSDGSRIEVMRWVELSAGY